MIAGRLLLVRLESSRRSIDIITGYQYVDDRTPSSKHNRSFFWDSLDKLLHSLPKRNTLVLAGDWSYSLRIPHTGCATFKHGDRRVAGPQHYDQAVFEQLLVTHSLVALNSFDAELGPTYVNHHHASRIDCVCARYPEADGQAKSPVVFGNLSPKRQW